jgi:molybdopterin-containing oxidoreductase family membrane subunit
MAIAHPEPPRDVATAESVLAPGHTFGSVTDKISAIVLTRPYQRRWIFGFAVSFALMMLLLVSIANLLLRGIGIWGINHPVMWGFDIVNFVWWIGIGHAGTSGRSGAAP